MIFLQALKQANLSLTRFKARGLCCDALRGKIVPLGVLMSILISPVALAQICNPNASATSPSSDFMVHQDGTVTHLTTGLMWKVCTEGQTWSASGCGGTASTHTWSGALQISQILNAGGGYPLSGANYADWRLPNLKELKSIVEFQCRNPAINETIFPSTASSGTYWSSSPYLISGNGVRGVVFGHGGTSSNLRHNGNRVRLVRSDEVFSSEALSEGITDIKEGLIAHYEFENNTEDSSGNGHNGIENGSISYVTGAVGRAIKFDGNYRNYIRVPHSNDLNINGDYTFSYWIYREYDSGTQVPFSKGRDCLNSYYSSSGGQSFTIGHGNYGGSWCDRKRVGMVFPINEWHFITGIINNSDSILQYYLNGKLEKEVSIPPYATTNTYDLVLGRHDTLNNGGSSWPYPYIGKLDDMRIYSRVLSDTEILELYKLGLK